MTHILLRILNDLQITGGLDTTSQFIDESMTEDRLKVFAKTFFNQLKKQGKILTGLRIH